jgi:hypothetical protein
VLGGLETSVDTRKVDMNSELARMLQGNILFAANRRLA